jgi:periplasmic protein CpxP/Spy
MNTISPRWIATLLLLLSLTPAAASAADSTAPAQGAPQHGPWTMRGLETLHTDLKLNPKQETLWQSAATRTKEMMAQMRNDREQMRSAMLQELSKPQADLRALANGMDAARTRHTDLRKEAREQWLALYDNLDPNQRETARQFLLTRVQHARQGHRHGHHRPQPTPTPAQ